MAKIFKEEEIEMEKYFYRVASDPLIEGPVLVEHNALIYMFTFTVLVHLSLLFWSFIIDS